MRNLIVTFFFAAVVSAMAQGTSASEQLKEKFLAILQRQVTSMMGEAASQSPLPIKPEDMAKQVNAIMTEAEANYAAVLTVPEAEASRLLGVGPDDKANLAAMKRDIELWKKVQRPMPVLYKRMQDEVVSGEIKGGLELELTRRISEFHLHQLERTRGQREN